MGPAFKRMTIDRADEPWLLHRRVAVTRRSDEGFTANVALVCIDSVTEPQWAHVAGTVTCIADSGYSWVHHVPHRGEHVTTTFFDPTGGLVGSRVDICSLTGVNMNGVAWFDPLPLHLMVSPGSRVDVAGGAELDGAVQDRRITDDDRDRAWNEARWIAAEIAEDGFPPIRLGPLHLAELMPYAG